VGLALLGSLLLNGCAVMSPEECTHADWYALGQADGAKGRDRQYLQERISVCAKAQVAADTGRYAQGYAQGLQQYCVVENAFSLGANGGQYKGVCPAAIDPQFRRRFDAGRAIYDTRQEVKRLQERINDKERELTQTHKDEERKLRDPKSADDAAALSAILSSAATGCALRSSNWTASCTAPATSNTMQSAGADNTNSFNR